MGSGGGGSSGKVAYPAYLENIHSSFLNDTGSDNLDYSLVDLLNDAYATNPYEDSSLSVYSGRALIDNSGAQSMTTVASAVAATLALIASFDPYDYYSEKLPLIATAIDAELLDDAIITAASTAFSAVLEPDIAAEKAKYDADMVLLGSSMSSAYTLGKSFIDARKAEKVELYDADLRAKMYLQRNDAIRVTAMTMLERQLQHIQLSKDIYGFAVEGVKLKILNEREYTEQNMSYLGKKGTWRFEAMQNGFNAIASIGGGTASANTPKMSATQATVSGAFSGAAMGNQIYPGYGAAVGAIVGGVAGYLSR